MNMGWEIVRGDGSKTWISDSSGYVTDVRPLVVLDLAPGDAEEIVSLLRGHAKTSKARCLETADQIEAQAKSSRISEPGLWAVVEARLDYTASATRRFYIHTPNGWREAIDGLHVHWAQLVDPVLIREGVEVR